MALTTLILAKHEALIIPNIKTKPKKVTFVAVLNCRYSYGAVSLYLAVTLAQAALPTSENARSELIVLALPQFPSLPWGWPQYPTIFFPPLELVVSEHYS